MGSVYPPGDLEEGYPSSAFKMTPTGLLFCVVLCLIIFISISGNSLVLFVLKKRPQLQNTTGWFVANLAIADLGGSLINMPVSAVCALADSFPFPNFLCLATGFTNSVFCGASIVLLALVSIDRYVAISKPFEYPTLMTTNRIAMITIGGWIYAFAIALPPFFGIGQYHYLHSNAACTLNWQSDILSSLFATGAIFGVPLAVLLFSYSHIFREANKHIKAIKELHACLPVSAGGAITADGRSAGCNQHQKKFTDSKPVKTLLVVLGVFILCWVPFFSLNMVAVIGHFDIPDPVVTTSVWIAYSNSACNPFIYGLMNRKYREAFFQIIRSCQIRSLKRDKLHNPIDRQTNNTENKAQQTEGRIVELGNSSKQSPTEPWVTFRSVKLGGDNSLKKDELETNTDGIFMSTTVAEISPTSFPERKRGSSNTTTTTIRTSSLPSDHSPKKENFRII